MIVACIVQQSIVWQDLAERGRKWCPQQSSSQSSSSAFSCRSCVLVLQQGTDTSLRNSLFRKMFSARCGEHLHEPTPTFRNLEGSEDSHRKSKMLNFGCVGDQGLQQQIACVVRIPRSLKAELERLDCLLPGSPAASRSVQCYSL